MNKKDVPEVAVVLFLGFVDFGMDGNIEEVL